MAEMMKNDAPQMTKPYIHIIEQPAGSEFRFRYESEKCAVGNIPGAGSTKERKTYPSIEIVADKYKGRVDICVSCVTKNVPYRSHPHDLVGEDCKDGICRVNIEVDHNRVLVVFSKLGVRCVKMRDFQKSLSKREKLKVDPFQHGFAHMATAKQLDVNVVRLCFQGVTSDGELLTPVVSNPIYNRKAVPSYKIIHLSLESASVMGNEEITLCCEKIAKDDVRVRFYEEQNGQVVWEELLDIPPHQIHHSTAMWFKIPPYKRRKVTKPFKIDIQLERASDGAKGDPYPFILTPCETDEPKFKRVKTDSTKQMDDDIKVEVAPKTPESCKHQIETKIHKNYKTQSHFLSHTSNYSESSQYQASAEVSSQQIPQISSFSRYRPTNPTQSTWSDTPTPNYEFLQSEVITSWHENCMQANRNANKPNWSNTAPLYDTNMEFPQHHGNQYTTTLNHDEHTIYHYPDTSTAIFSYSEPNQPWLPTINTRTLMESNNATFNISFVWNSVNMRTTR